MANEWTVAIEKPVTREQVEALTRIRTDDDTVCELVTRSSTVTATVANST